MIGGAAYPSKGAAAGPAHPLTRVTERAIAAGVVTREALLDLTQPVFGNTGQSGELFLSGHLHLGAANPERGRVFYRTDLWLLDDGRVWVQMLDTHERIMSHSRHPTVSDLRDQVQTPTGVISSYAVAARRVLERYEAGDSDPRIVTVGTELLLGVLRR